MLLLLKYHHPYQPPPQITLETARLIKEDFLQQNSFSSYDRFCPFYKSVEMLKNMIYFYDVANRAVERTASCETKLSYNTIKNRCGQLLYKLSSMKFEEPSEGEHVLKAKYKALREEIDATMATLEDECR